MIRSAAARILILLCLAASWSAVALPAAAHASGYCGKAGGLRVYTSGIACSTARYYVARRACPRGWARYRIYQPFGFEVIGYGCRSGGRRFKGQRYSGAARSPTARGSACPDVITLGSRTYVYYQHRVNCTRARRAVRRLYASRGARGRPRGFRCESGSRFRRGGNCYTRGRARYFGWHPFD